MVDHGAQDCVVVTMPRRRTAMEREIALAAVHALALMGRILRHVPANSGEKEPAERAFLDLARLHGFTVVAHSDTSFSVSTPTPGQEMSHGR